jgi:hypothetical protein
MAARHHRPRRQKMVRRCMQSRYFLLVNGFATSRAQSMKSAKEGQHA